MQTTTFMKVLSGLLMMVFLGTLQAQDIIITKDAQKIEAKVLESSNSEIKYKKQSNLEGPTFVVSISELNSVIYANGEVQVFNSTTKEYKTNSLSDENQISEDCGLSKEENEFIYSTKQFKGGELPKFTYKKVQLPNRSGKVYRYVGGNMMLTEKEFLKFCKKYCREASRNYWWGLPSQTLLIYNTNCAGTIAD